MLVVPLLLFFMVSAFLLFQLCKKTPQESRTCLTFFCLLQKRFEGKHAFFLGSILPSHRIRVQSFLKLKRKKNPYTSRLGSGGGGVYTSGVVLRRVSGTPKWIHPEFIFQVAGWRRCWSR